MMRPAWSRPTSMPCRRRTRQALRTPYTLKCSAWMRLISLDRTSSETARADGGRTFAA